MKKRTYETPVADLLVFDYREQVKADSGGIDASHCVSGRNQGQCSSKNQNKCTGVTGNPGQCHD